MEKQLITFDQLAALSFYRFGKLDGVDMSLLIRECSDMVSVELHDECDDYVVTGDGMIMLAESYLKKMNKNIDSELFDKISGDNIQRYLENIDMYRFVLKKIKMLNPCYNDREEVLRNFSLLQIRFLNKLYQERYVMESINNNCHIIKLTKRGELYLFLGDYNDEIKKFMVLLDDCGYNKQLIEPFLITQDLSLDVHQILILDNFIAFFGKYDVNPYVKDLYRYGRKKVRTVI